MCGFVRADGVHRPVTDRWVHLRNDLTTDAKLAFSEDVIRRAAKSGYTGVLWDAAVGAEGFDHDAWDAVRRARLAKAKRLCDDLGLEIVPLVWSVGRAHSILHYDPNLGETTPVRDVPYVVKGGKAVFVPEPAPAIRLPSGRFEPGVTYKSGDFAPKRFRRYRVSAKMRLNDVRNAPKPHLYFWRPLGDETHKYPSSRICYARITKALEPKNTDWQDFCLDLQTRDRELCCLWGGCTPVEGTTVDFKDWKFEEMGLCRVLRGPGAPFAVKSADGKATYEEGRDYAVPAGLPPHPTKDELHAREPSLELTIPKGSRIRDGERILIDAYELVEVGPRQFAACMSDPRLYDYFRESAKVIRELFAPKKVMFSSDEIRAAGTCALCESRKTDLAHIFADCVNRQKRIISDEIPGVTVYAWSDMFVPCRNAIKSYELCADTTFEGSADLVDKDIVMAAWGGSPHKDEIDFLKSKGFRMIGCGYYDEKTMDGAWKWRDAYDANPEFIGLMYTTWTRPDGKYDLLEAWGRLLNLPPDAVREPMP